MGSRAGEGTARWEVSRNMAEILIQESEKVLISPNNENVGELRGLG